MAVMDQNPVTVAIQIVGLRQLAAELGVTYQAVRKFERTGRVPAKRCLPIERLTGGRVSRYWMRPDVFGAHPDPAPRP